MITEFRASISAAYDAINAGDFVTAVKHARAARMALMAIPDSKLKEEEITISRDDIDLMIRDLDAQARSQSNQEAIDSGSGSVRVFPHRRRRVSR